MKLNKIYIGLMSLLFLGVVLYLSPIGKSIKDKIAPQNIVNENTVIPLTEKEMQMELKGITAKDINLADLKGKVIFVNFWGTWCGPCKFEMPSIQTLYSKYQNKVSFVTIALPARGEEVRDGVIEYLKENNFNLPAYELLSLPSIKFESNVVPVTFIIDKKGNIVYKLDGAKNWDDEETNQLLNKLINQ